MNALRTALLFAATAIFATACASAPGEDETTDGTSDELVSGRGVNSNYCVRSPFNCQLRGVKSSGQRVERTSTSENTMWPVAVRPVTVLGGDGKPKGAMTIFSPLLNYGQVRTFGGQKHVYALSAGIGPGWVPVAAFADKDLILAHVGSAVGKGATADGTKLRALGCFHVRSESKRSAIIEQSANDGKDRYKILKNTTVDEQEGEPNDYLPVQHAGVAVPYMAMTFNVPGDAIGGPSIDTFPKGTIFHRLDVPLWGGNPHSYLDVKLWKRNNLGPKAVYDVPSDLAPMRFYYGYVESAGERRYGWMAEDGLDAGSCK
jgi:hypothetical protein